MTDNSEKIAMRVSRNSIYGNLLISIAKFLAGVIGHSSAMISDAIHSASDVFSTIVVMIGVKIGGKESDKNHQNGHERLESVASLILALTLAVTGCGIGYGGLKTIIAGSEGASIQVPTALPLAAAILSIVAKEGMYWYTMRAADQFRCLEGRRLASSFRCFIVGRKFGGNRRSYAWIPDSGSYCQCDYLRIYSKSSL